MGHKVHPMGFRIGVIRDWQAKWYAEKHYAEFLQEDLHLRKAIESRYADAGVSRIDIERQANQVTIGIHTARPGIVIGRGGQRVDETRATLEKLIGKKVQLNIHEIQQAELDAHLVGKSIAEQMEHRVAYRRAMKQAMLRSMQAGAKGIRITCGGRLGGAEIARRLTMHEGQVPLHTLRADIDYSLVEAHTTMGRIGVKVWIYKGDILPEKKAAEETAEAAEPAGTRPEAATPPPQEEKEQPETRRRIQPATMAEAPAGEKVASPAKAAAQTPEGTGKEH